MSFLHKRIDFSSSCANETLITFSTLPSFVHAIQPMLLCEGLLRPASDLNTLAFHLQAVAIMHNISFAELIFEVLRCLLLTISQKEGFESLKMDSFILVIYNVVLICRSGLILCLSNCFYKLLIKVIIKGIYF
jgi:hypothetical protein